MQGIINPRVGDYTLKSGLGEGAFSVVRLATNDKTGKQCACKIVPLTSLSTSNLQQHFEREIRILQQMRHQNIVQMYDIEKDKKNYYIFMEYCSQGELFQHIVDCNFLQERESKFLFKQFIDAIAYLHANNVAHRDLKPENLLLDTGNKLKVSDFGFARFVQPNTLCSTTCGSPCYASPETLAGKQYDAFKSDIWSSGVILYAMVTGQLPWTKTNQTELFDQIKSADYKIPTYLTEECQDLIKNLLVVDPNARLTAKQVQEHPWLTNTPTFIPENVTLCPITLKSIDQFFGREISVLKFTIKRKCQTPRKEDDFDTNQRYIEKNYQPISKLPQLEQYSGSKTKFSKPSAYESVKKARAREPKLIKPKPNPRKSLPSHPLKKF